jgi:hypothetical protein
MNATEESKLMKRLIDAVKGRPLSWSLTHDIKRLTGRSYNGGEKLLMSDRAQVQLTINDMAARGVKPAATLLTECQQQAIRRRSLKGNGRVEL